MNIPQQNNSVKKLTVSDILGPQGLLARSGFAYELRRPQLEMAEHTHQALSSKSPLIVQGSTGTGKGFAYLIAALCAGDPFIVSTYSKVLQSQLKDHDLPWLKEVSAAVNRHFTFATLKGRASYVCLHELKKLQTELDDGLIGLQDRASVDAWEPMITWVHDEAESGGLADVDYAPVPLTSELRERMTTDSDHCLGSKQCPMAKQCFAERAKARAKTADVLVVNHHLLLTDQKLREQGGSFLPNRDVIIVDEAHMLEAVATDVSAIRLTYGRWRRLAQRGRTLAERLSKHLMATAAQGAPQTVDALLRGMSEDTDTLQQAIDEAVTAGAGAQSEAEYTFKSWLADLGDEQKVSVPTDAHYLIEATHAWGAAVARVATELHGRRSAPAGETDEDTPEEPEHRTLLTEWCKLSDLIARLAYDLEKCLTDESNYVRFLEKVEGRTPRAVLTRCMIHVGKWLDNVLWTPYTTVSCSATLTTYEPGAGHTFGYWMDRVGHPPADTLQVESPFDYRKNCLLYLPSPPEAFNPPVRKPSESPAAYRERAGAYYSRLSKEILTLLEASNGRALILFTSGAAMRRVADLVRPSMRWPLLVQGELERLTLLDTFRRDVHSVLFATKSFWQGVDVSGASLSLLVIDKLPFEVPTDPVFEARVADVKQRHGPGSEWSKFTIPLMITWVQQAFGRLIRRSDDRGVVAILDGRVRLKSYGTTTIKSLPPAPVTHALADVQHFFREEGSHGHD
jgi:ATP-dependent DNA helicase DinG